MDGRDGRVGILRRMELLEARTENLERRATRIEYLEPTPDDLDLPLYREARDRRSISWRWRRRAS